MFIRISFKFIAAILRKMFCFIFKKRLPDNYNYKLSIKSKNSFINVYSMFFFTIRLNFLLQFTFFAKISVKIHSSVHIAAILTKCFVFKFKTLFQIITIHKISIKVKVVFEK